MAWTDTEPSTEPSTDTAANAAAADRSASVPEAVAEPAPAAKRARARRKAAAPAAPAAPVGADEAAAAVPVVADAAVVPVATQAAQKTAQKAAPKRPRKVASPGSDAARPLSLPARAEVDCEVVRDSFTVPQDEYAALDSLKRRALTLQLPMKKSELLRAGLKLLASLDDGDFALALTAVPLVKTGRPKAKGEKARRRKA